MEYLISDFSIISRLGVKTLRYYHDIGLLHPSRVDKYTGYRYYDENNLVQVRAIHHLKDLNFTLTEIRDILFHESGEMTLLKSIQTKLTEMDEKITEYQQVRDRLAAFVTSESVPLIFPERVTEKKVTEQLIASIRFVGCCNDLDENIRHLIVTCGGAISGVPFSLYYDDHPQEEDADIEICVPISEPVYVNDVQTRELPGGRMISIIHHGNYDQIWVSYQAVVDYLNQNKLTPIYPSREIYLKGGNSSQRAQTQEYLTEIQFLFAES
jgi:DNA-binding transcriptional MerR regulator